MTTEVTDSRMSLFDLPIEIIQHIVSFVTLQGKTIFTCFNLWLIFMYLQTCVGLEPRVTLATL